MTINKLSCFSPTGEKFAHVGSDNFLRIWNTSSGVLEHEFQCLFTATCLRYSPTVGVKNKPKGEKRRSLDGNQGSVLAMGTTTGTILLHCPEKKQVIGTLEHGPQNAILDLAWRSATKLFALGENNILVEWDITTGEKAASAKINGGSSICAIQKNVLAAGNKNIKVVTLVKGTDKPKVKCEFTGHSTAVSQLLSVQGEDGSPKIILSAAQDDKHICAWDLETMASETVGRLIVKETIASVASSPLKENTLLLSAVTSNGVLKIFRQHLNGNKNRKPVKPTGTLKICTEDKKEVIPIVSSFLRNDLASSVIIAYGSTSTLKFENIDTMEISGQKELVRADSNTTPKKETELKSSKLTNGEDGTPTTTPASVGKVNKRKLDSEMDTTPVPSVKNPDTARNETSATTDVMQLLLRGLNNKDKQLLENVFANKDQIIINKTVQQFPEEAILPVLKQLQSFVLGKAHKHCSYVSWMRSILYYHMNHLTALPDRAELVRPFSASASKVDTLAKVTQLHARLDLLLNHVATRHQEVIEPDVGTEDILIYRDDDESDTEYNALGAESDDNWEEVPDFGETNGHSDKESEGESDMEVDGQFSAAKRRLEEDSSDKTDDEEIIEIDNNGDDN